MQVLNNCTKDFAGCRQAELATQGDLKRQACWVSALVFRKGLRIPVSGDVPFTSRKLDAAREFFDRLDVHML